MNSAETLRCFKGVRSAVAAFCLITVWPSEGHSAVAGPDRAVILQYVGEVEVLRGGSPQWDPARTNLVLRGGDQLRTGKRSRVTLRLSGRTLWEVGAGSVVRVPSEKKRGFNLFRGIFHLFHRDAPGEFPVETPSSFAGVLGTEFVVRVDEDGATTLYLLDGKVALTNEFGRLHLTSGQAGLAAANRKPEPTAMLEAVNLVQWFLYYPGVLHVPELELGAAIEAELEESLNAWRAGDLPEALRRYPTERQPATDAEEIYLAALVLVAGQVEEADQLLDGVNESDRLIRLASAVRRIIAAVKSQPDPAEFFGARAEATATEWLAESYYRQSQRELGAALKAAREAVTVAPDFAFAWERVAELEFGFSRTRRAREALERSLALAPRNAQAVALKGFLLAAENAITEAIEQFDDAIALDGGLGNAWLGRGLCRIRGGDVVGGREDLQVAAAAEPRRGVLRGYLGKAFDMEGDVDRALHELELAKTIDPNDPTAWLYSALVRQQENQINEAVKDLQRSQALNGNRAVYRSRERLDEDEAVRGANLAAIYRDAGMVDVSVREALQAVNVDYANYSAHLFLANSYQALRDPNQLNLRYETPWFSEYLVANLLAPVTAGALSQAVSQEEYSRLFERERLGAVSSTEYLSRGDWTQTAAQFGILGDFGYSVDAFYRSRNGQRRSDDLDLLSLSVTAKQQLTPEDSLFVQAVYYRAEGGDLVRHYDPSDANAEIRVVEDQSPLLLAGYHHEWGPGSHTLLLAGMVSDNVEVANPFQDSFLFSRPGGTVSSVVPHTIEQTYRNELDLYTVEAQQILQRGNHTWIAGGRYQLGHYDTENQHANPLVPPPLPGYPVPPQPGGRTDSERANLYGYWHWRALSGLLLVGGISYDWLQFPVNLRYAPLSTREETTDQISPKGGFVWNPFTSTTIRAAYAQSLGGASIDQSFQLEPSQVAGFNQAWRSIIPESVAGASSAAEFENWGVSLEQKVGVGTYLGASFEALRSEVERFRGIYDYVFVLPNPPVIAPGQTPQRLDYEEKTLLLTADQLLGANWSLGARYRLSRATLEDDFSEIPSSATIFPMTFQPHQDLEAWLHQVNLRVLYTHPCGFFGFAEALWSQQSNQGYEPDRPGDDFWQFNLFAGYRFPRRRVEVRFGLLNLTDQDYRLNPLNLTAELPRERTFLAGLRFHF